MKFTSLQNNQLLAALQQKSFEERKLTLEIIEPLEEVDRRSLHLQMGYGSLIHFCTQELHYSERESYRRISACPGEPPPSFCKGSVNFCDRRRLLSNRQNSRHSFSINLTRILSQVGTTLVREVVKLIKEFLMKKMILTTLSVSLLAVSAHASRILSCETLGNKSIVITYNGSNLESLTVDGQQAIDMVKSFIFTRSGMSLFLSNGSEFSERNGTITQKSSTGEFLTLKKCSITDTDDQEKPAEF